MLRYCYVQLCSLREMREEIFLDFEIEIKILRFTEDIKYHFILLSKLSSQIV